MVSRSDKYGNKIARVLQVIGDLPLTATDGSHIHSIDELHFSFTGHFDIYVAR